MADKLFVIDSGFVSASLERLDGLLEVGRMGPGERIGVGGFADETPTLSRFCAYKDCMIGRIDRADLEPRLSEHPELLVALAGLAEFRVKARAVLLEASLWRLIRGWLRKNVRRFRVARAAGCDVNSR